MSAQPAALESITVGDIEVTYLPDGDAVVSATALFPSGNQALWDAHPELFDTDGKLVLSLGGFLIRTGDRNVLVDLGFGDLTVDFPAADGQFRAGRLLTSLRTAGLGPEDIDTVFYTHMHLDHVGWTAQDGKVTFDNARHLAGPGEFAFWAGLGDAPLAAVGPHPEAVIAPLSTRIDEVADGASLAPGVTVVATPGHTPGHCSLVLSSGGQKAMLLGDIVHCPVQLSDAEVGMAFDFDPQLAVRTRDRIAAELAGETDTLVAQGHFSGSVFGRVVRSADTRSWTGWRA